MSIGVRHKGHPFPIPLAVSAHAEQKRAWLHGTNATLSHGTSRQTSHISVAGDVADVVDVADATSVHRWLPVLPSLCNPWYLSQPSLHVLWSTTGVSYACVNVELEFVFQVLHFPVLHFLVLHFPPLHFWSCIFQYCILVPQTWHHWSRIFWSHIFSTPPLFISNLFFSIS